MIRALLNLLGFSSTPTPTVADATAALRIIARETRADVDLVATELCIACDRAVELLEGLYKTGAVSKRIVGGHMVVYTVAR